MLVCVYFTSYLIHMRLTREPVIGQVDSCASTTGLRINFGKCKQQAKYSLTLNYDPRGLVMHLSVGVYRV